MDIFDEPQVATKPQRTITPEVVNVKGPILEKAKKSLSVKQMKYVECKGQGKTGLVAKEEAGLGSASTVIETAICKKLGIDNLSELFAEVLDLPKAIQRLNDSLDASYTREFCTREGDVVSGTPFPDNRERREAAKDIIKMVTNTRGEDAIGGQVVIPIQLNIGLTSE